MNKHTIRNVFTLSLLMVTLTACLQNSVKLEPGAERVEVGTQNPGKQYTAIGSISAESGSKCSKNPIDPKEIGSYEITLNKLKNKAAKATIDFVEITSTTEPRYKLNCIGRHYQITGTAYRLNAPRERIEKTKRIKSPGTSITTKPATRQSVKNKRPVNLEPELNTTTTTETNGNAHQLSKQLRELHNLKKEGVISKKEYQKLKDKIIDRF